MPGFFSTSLMMWNPYCVFTRSLISPGSAARTPPASNSGTIRPRPKKSRSPPFGAVRLVFGILRGERGEVGAAFACFSSSSACALDGGFVLAFRLEQDVARADLLGRRVLLDVVVVGALDVGRRHDHLRAHRVDVDEQVPDLPLLGNPEVVRVRLEVARHLGIGRADTSGAKLSVGKVTTASFTLSLRRRYSCFDLLVGNRQPLGHRGPQLLDDERPADAVFELGRWSSAGSACRAAAGSAARR